MTPRDPSASKRRWPLLLVSVRNADEAREAIAGGADIIDVKEPLRGPLGRPDACVVREIAETTLALHKPLTAALGEWHEEPPSTWLGTALPHLALAKVGLSSTTSRVPPKVVEPTWQESVARLAEKVSRLSGGTCRLVLTAYADHAQCGAPSISQVLESASGIGSPFLLIDTFFKSGTGFWSFFDWKRYSHLLRQCEDAGLPLAVAGSLDIQGVARLMEDPPAVIAVRGAACSKGLRSNAVCRSNVAAIASVIKGIAFPVQQASASRN